jgi:hypothetical protein
LFNPGAKLALSMRLGDAEPYPIGIAYLDEVQYDVTAKSVPISGRNSVGYLLKDQSFSADTLYEDTAANEIAESILELAGVTTHTVYSGINVTFEFGAGKSYLDALQDMFEFFSGPTDSWRLVELPDGEIIVGYGWQIAAYHQPTGYYEFNGGSEVFKRKTRKNADAAYSAVRVTGAEGLEPVTVQISNFPYWSIPPNKVCHVSASKYFDSQEKLQALAEALAAQMQAVGITEEFVSPLRPQLIVGDVASVYYDGDAEATDLGVITEVTHNFGETGYSTEFTVDSGGVATDADDYVITRAAALSGYNRKQRMMDFIRSVNNISKLSR